APPDPRKRRSDQPRHQVLPQYSLVVDQQPDQNAPECAHPRPAPGPQKQDEPCSLPQSSPWRDHQGRSRGTSSPYDYLSDSCSLFLLHTVRSIDEYADDLAAEKCAATS